LSVKVGSAGRGGGEKAGACCVGSGERFRTFASPWRRRQARTPAHSTYRKTWRQREAAHGGEFGGWKSGTGERRGEPLRTAADDKRRVEPDEVV